MGGLSIPLRAISMKSIQTRIKNTPRRKIKQYYYVITYIGMLFAGLGMITGMAFDAYLYAFIMLVPFTFFLYAHERGVDI